MGVAMAVGSAALGLYGQNKALEAQGRANAQTAKNLLMSMNYSLQNMEQERADAFDATIDELEKLKEQLVKAKETKKEEEVKPVEEKKEEVPVIAKADEPIEPSPKMVTTEVPDTPISAKARMQRANIVARTAQLEDEWLEANGMNYNEDQCLTAANDCIEYITPIIHEEFGIDAISANTLVSEVVRDNFRDDYSSDETSDEPVSDGCSKEETTANNDGTDNVSEGNKKQSDRPKVVENNRLAEF